MQLPSDAGVRPVGGLTGNTTQVAVAGAQMVTLAAHYCAFRGAAVTGGDLQNFRDAGQIDEYAREAIAWAVENGILESVAEELIMPHGNANRAQKLPSRCAAAKGSADKHRDRRSFLLCGRNQENA